MPSERLIDCVQAEIDLQADRHPPYQHPSAESVHHLSRDSADGRSATLADGRSDWPTVWLAQLRTVLRGSKDGADLLLLGPTTHPLVVQIERSGQATPTTLNEGRETCRESCPATDTEICSAVINR